MIQNNFTLIGTALTNFECEMHGNFESQKITIEVEAYGGKTSEIVVDFSGKYSKLDFRKDYRGCAVAIGGYIKSTKYIGKDGVERNYLNIQGNEMYVIGNSKAIKPVISGDNLVKEAPEMGDDDLPF